MGTSVADYWTMDSMTEKNNPASELHEFLQESLARCQEVPPLTSVLVHRASGTIEILLDTKANVYSEWIKGEGADIHLLRDMETHKVMGCRLPLIHSEVRFDEI